MRRVKTAVIGAGFMGRVHSEAIRRVGNVDIVGVAALDDAEAAAFGQSIGVERTTGDPSRAPVPTVTVTTEKGIGLWICDIASAHLNEVPGIPKFEWRFNVTQGGCGDGTLLRMAQSSGTASAVGFLATEEEVAVVRRLGFNVQQGFTDRLPIADEQLRSGQRGRGPREMFEDRGAREDRESLRRDGGDAERPVLVQDDQFGLNALHQLGADCQSDVARTGKPRLSSSAAIGCRSARSSAVLAGWPTMERFRLRSRAAALLMVVIVPAASIETTPVVMRSRIVSM